MSYDEKIASSILDDDDKQALEDAAAKQSKARGGWSSDGQSYEESKSNNSILPKLRALKENFEQLKLAKQALQLAEQAIDNVINLLPEIDLDMLVNENEFLKEGYQDYSKRYKELITDLGTAVKESDLYNEVDQEGYFEKHGYKRSKQ